MDYFVIVRGALGCGKTTIAKRLATILHAKYISIDEVLEVQGLDTVEPDAGCIPTKNFIQANKIIIPNVTTKLQDDPIVVFDACFYHREQIEHLMRNLPYPHYVFTLKAPVEVCIERDSKRVKSHGEDAVRAIHMLVSRFDYGTVIDVTKSLDAAVDEILSYLSRS